MTTEAADYTVNVEKPGAWSRRLTITVPAERIEREKKTAVERLAKRVKLPGFRQGRVPAAVMERKFGPAIEQEAVQKLIGDVYKQALESEGLQPITQGSIDHIHYEPGSDLVFHVDLEVRPEIELERLGGFTVMRELLPVGEQQLDDVLERLRTEHASWRTKEELPTTGDMATVEITPLDATTPAEQGKPRRYQIVIGEGQALPAVEDALRTLRGGEEAEFEVDLPVNPEEPAGETKPHRMQIKMIEVKAPELPALDDEFAKSVGDFDSLETLRSRVREDLQREADTEAERALRMQLMQHILDANAFEVPQSMVANYLERVMPAREGADEERVKQARMEMWPAAEQAIKRSLVVERIAEMEALHASPGEIDARVDAIAERLGRPRGEVLGQLRKSGRIDEMEQEITEEKVFQYLKSLSDVQ
jgi:trigger factor